jgi:hypothetical protein
MTDAPIDDRIVAELARRSRRNAVLTVASGLLILGSLTFSAYRITEGEERVSALRTKQDSLAHRNDSLAERIAQLTRVVDSLTGPLAKVVVPQSTATLVPHATTAAGQPLSDYVISLKVPEGRQKEIATVTYHFDNATALVQQRSSTNAANGFAVSYRGFGCFGVIHIEIVLTDGRHTDIPFDQCSTSR